MDIWRISREGFQVLRICSILFLVATVCLVGFDSQTRLIFSSISRTATFRDMNALVVLVWIDSAAAAYNLLRVVVGLLSSRFKVDLLMENSSNYRLILAAWLCFLLDQIAAYVVFAANTRALTASALAVTGAPIFQWIKVCDRYTKFCSQIGGALLCGYIASLLMALISSLSAFTLFRLYSPKHFLLLKPK